MKMTSVHNEIPVWEVSDFDLPHVDWVDTGCNDQGNNNPLKELRRVCNVGLNSQAYTDFTDAWDGHTTYLENFLREDVNKHEFFKPIWMDRLDNITFTPLTTSLVVIQDLPGFQMSRHIDNRFVLGVLIINLQDNPKSTCTNFWSNNLDDKEPWYKSSTKKGTGVFMLNSWNTRHSIEISPAETESRMIGYQTINIPAIL
jgi:hypothetical protein